MCTFIHTIVGSKKCTAEVVFNAISFPKLYACFEVFLDFLNIVHNSYSSVHHHVMRLFRYLCIVSQTVVVDFTEYG
jgi:hypothetical protein